MYLFFLGINLCVRLLSLRLYICLTLLDVAKQFSKMAVTLYTPSAKYELSSCSSFSSTLDIVTLSNFGHSGGCIVGTHGFNLQFPSE